MLTKKQIQEAVRYNLKRISDGNMRVAELPWPWSDGDQKTFSWAVALFQAEKGLVVDGKLGPATQKRLGSDGDTPVETPRPRPPVIPGKMSNAIIVNGESVPLPEELLKAGLTATNFAQDGELHFSKRIPFPEKVTNFVLHETCGNTAKGCLNTLEKKKYGIHLIMAPSGHISCHADLLRDRVVHANQMNNRAFGIEVVNPYNPIYVVDKAIWSRTIVRQWWTWVPSEKDEDVKKILKRKKLSVVPKLYTLPTPPQMDAIRLLAPWLCEITGVPYRFPTRGLNEQKRKIDGINMKPRAKPGPGVVAHQDFAGHSDGRYMLEDLIERAG
jgi:hypothetical protein